MTLGRAASDAAGQASGIHLLAAEIAAAVETQGVMTREIATNVEQAAIGTADVAANIADVSQFRFRRAQDRRRFCNPRNHSLAKAPN